MTQRQLDRAVAAATGESVATIHRLGFVAGANRPAVLEPEDLHLVVQCPFCRRPVPYPGPDRDGPAALAECDGCDVDFDFDPGEVYAAGPVETVGSCDAA